MFYRGKTVAVVGGGNSAAADALLLSKICEKVYLIHRRDSLRAERAYHNPLMQAENVEFVLNTTVSKILSENTVRAVRVKNVITEEETEIPLNGVFISIGRDPNTALFKGQLELDSYGYIIADETTKTNIDGVFAVGDVRTKPVRQIVTATGDGAVAAHFAEEYIANL
jgi:thioredoxin reductase (NADPH)